MATERASAAPELGSAPAPEAFRLDFRPARHCPSAEHFVYELRARTPVLVPARPGDPALTFVVEVTQLEAGYRGRLVLVEIDGGRTERTVDLASNCAEVLSALSLMGAVLVDPTADIAPVAPPPDLNQDEPSAPPPPPSAPPRRVPRRPGLGFGPTLQTGFAPVAALGVSAYVEGPVSLREDWDSSWRIEAHWARTAALQPDGRSVPLERAEAQFSWLSARLRGCPWQLELGRPELTFRPCAFADLGLVIGTGYQVRAARTAIGAWSALGVSGSVDWVWADVLTVGAQGGVGVPLIRDRFRFIRPYADEELLVHEYSVVALHGQVTVGLRFF